MRSFCENAATGITWQGRQQKIAGLSGSEFHGRICLDLKA
jgi:hypothetical protein